MAVTILAAVAAAAVVTAAVAAARARAARRLASPETGTAEHPTDWQTAVGMPALPPAPPPGPARWHEVTVPDMAAAERLFERLDERGVADRELVVDAGRFTVRWRGGRTG